MIKNQLMPFEVELVRILELAVLPICVYLIDVR
jgi:hypothetical protein